MIEEFISPYKMDDKKEKRLWKNAIFIFDTSVLLNFYAIPKQTRDTIYRTFEKLENRLWLPAQVIYEFLNHRDSIFEKTIKELYNPIKSDLNKIQMDCKLIDNIINTTKNSDKHPYFEQINLNKLKNEIDCFQERIQVIKNDIVKDIEKVEKEILDCKNNDDIYNNIKKYFKYGKKFTYSEILEIIKEGKLRYEFKIPPGYKDKDDKEGFQIFGDLIIWKEILKYSKEQKKSIIFITDDIKEDWCHKDKKATERRILSPREELIKEIEEYSSVEFWMYNLPQFLYHANQYLQLMIKEKEIEEVLEFLEWNTKKQPYNRLPVEILKFECNQCGRIHQYNKYQLRLEFECVGSDERNMGIEHEYEAKEYFGCQCGNDIEVTFSVWEYPIGIHNYDEITIEGGTLIQGFQPTIDLYDNDIRCLLCERDTEDSWKSYVDYWMYEPIRNELPKRDRLKGIKEVRIGECNHCGTKHYICPNCGKLNCIETNLFHQAEGECVCSYKLQFREGEYILTKEKQIIQY